MAIGSLNTNSHKILTTKIQNCSCEGGTRETLAAFVDQDGDGVFNREKDLLLVFDANADNQYDAHDAAATVKMLRLMKDPCNTDLDGDGFPSQEDVNLRNRIRELDQMATEFSAEQRFAGKPPW